MYPEFCSIIRFFRSVQTICDMSPQLGLYTCKRPGGLSRKAYCRLKLPDLSTYEAYAIWFSEYEDKSAFSLNLVDKLCM